MSAPRENSQLGPVCSPIILVYAMVSISGFLVGVLLAYMAWHH